MKYFLWDWNGTLLDDTQAALDTLNVMLARRRRAPIGMEFYRNHFAFPVRPFYESIGMEIRDEEWDDLAREYHDLYREQAKRINAETVAALERVRAAGARQSIISALRQDLLDRDTAAYGVRHYMDHVYGVDNLDGSSKLARARELLALVRTEHPDADLVLVGDALHDKEVADDLGVACVLCAQGSHAGDRLAAVAPTAPTLVAAVELALGAGRAPYAR